MSEERSLDDAPALLAAMRAELEDLKSTMVARQYQRPTGDTELAYRATPKPGTLFMQGQTLQKAAYPALHAWAEVNGGGGYVVTPTTVTLPDMRDRFLVGAGGTVVLGGTGGAASRTLTIANLPPHDHNVSVSNHAGHFHDINSGTGSGGSHGGHASGTSNVTQPGSGIVLPSNYNAGNGDHSHPINTDTSTTGLSAHVVSETAVGSGAPLDNRPPYLGLNVAVWT